MTIVRIVGLMRSGTNLLTWMLRHNFADVRTATMLLGWKHGPIHRDKAALSIDDLVDPRYRDGIRSFVRDRPDEWARVTASVFFRDAAAAQRAQDFAVALAVRDPRLWYASCVRVQRQVPEFLPHGVRPPQAARFWNERHREWLDTLGERSVIVDTDALRGDPGPELDRMAERLRLRRTAELQVPGGLPASPGHGGNLRAAGCADHPGDGARVHDARGRGCEPVRRVRRAPGPDDPRSGSAWHETGAVGILMTMAVTMNRSNFGMVYVATRRPQYVAEAFLSAHSARDFAPGLPITLFTDLPQLALARSPCFSQVVPIETRRSYKSLWAEGQLDRIRSLQQSPYDYTLHLDSDTRVLTPEFMGLFDKLDSIDIGMAICQPDVSKCAQITGLPMFNVGFILFRRSAKAMQLLQAWEERTRSNFELGNRDQVPQIEGVRQIDDGELRRELLFMDQTSFVQLLSPQVNKFGVALEIMDESWNFRGTGGGRTFDRPVKISHHPGLRARLGEDIVLRAQQYQRAGQPALARAILQCLLDELVPPDNATGKAYIQGLIDQTGAG